MIKLETSGLLKKPNNQKYAREIERIITGMKERTLVGNDFLGWVEYPNLVGKTLINEINSCAKRIRENYNILVVCGIGGSYLGTRAVIDALKGVGPKNGKELEIIYFGNTFSPTYTKQTLEYLKGKNYAVNVISKSGTTTETSIAFRLLRNELESRYSQEECAQRIIVTTDEKKGLLKPLSLQKGYQSFVMPADVGGRYSVFTPVGLLPIAASGIDIGLLIQGARNGHQRYLNLDITNNEAAQYAIIRNFEYLKEKKTVELYTVYEPQFVMLNEWLKQLFGESEGKGKKGIFPCSVCYSTDLHSLGQFVQDGNPILFETNIQFSTPLLDISVPRLADDQDELNYLADKSLNYVNNKAFLGTKKAHVEEGKVSNLDIIIEKVDAEHLGELLYFFMVSCALSSYLLKINPFDQPGVEIYKKNMFALLGKK